MHRKLLISVVSLLVLFVVSEVVARVVFYQTTPRRALAVHEGFEWLRNKVTEWRRDREVEHATPFIQLYSEADNRLYSEPAREFLAELEASYEAHLVELAAAVESVGSKFFVLNFTSASDSVHARFIAALTSRLGIEYFDASGVLTPVPEEHKYLVPTDTHLSRYGNQLVATALAEYLDRHAGHASGATYDGSPIVLGDYTPSIRMTLTWNPDLGFRAVSNSHGFRMTEDLAIPKSRQRILCLGDSLTFGPHINNQDTYPSILARRRPDLEIVNAGITGYTIADQKSLFIERAQHSAPDVTLLQVCHNDIVELASFIRNRMGRGADKDFRPSDAETRYLDWIRREIEQRND